MQDATIFCSVIFCISEKEGKTKTKFCNVITWNMHFVSFPILAGKWNYTEIFPEYVEY